jgi:hypothetical protein
MPGSAAGACRPYQSRLRSSTFASLPPVALWNDIGTTSSFNGKPQATMNAAASTPAACR